MRYQWWKKASKTKVMIVAGVIVLLCSGIAVYKHMHAASSSQNARVQAAVNIAPVQRTDLIKRISLTGQTVPLSQVDIAAKYMGKVVAVNVALGQAVTPGQVLVVQDTGDADIAVLQNQAAYAQAMDDSQTAEATINANYDKANADYKKAVATYNRNKDLYDCGAISLDSLEVLQQTMADAKAALDTMTNQMNSGVSAAIQSARANALKAQHTVNATEKQRNDLVLQAPRSGVIGYRQVEVGDMVQVGQKLLSIYDNSQLYVDCTVSEQDLPALSIGMNVNVGIESLNKTFPGKIIYFSPASDPTNLTFTLRIALDNPDLTLKGGMFTRTVLNTVLRPHTLVVAKDSVLEKNGEYSVFVVNDKNTVEQRTVQVGARGDETIEILSGLNEGENIALNNLSRLRTGLVINSHLVPQNAGDNQ